MKIIVDAEDMDLLDKYNWTIFQNGHKKYARRSDKKLLHRLIMSRILEVSDTHFNDVDHVDGDGLNNRRENLRLANKSQNGANREKPCTNTSGYKGVSWHKAGQKWHFYINVRGKRIHLGLYSNILEAAKSYNNAAIEHFGEFARLNDV